jgi:class 3 adenylate cyclase
MRRPRGLRACCGAARSEQVSGLAVHAGARVMAEAGEDQILVSSDLAEILGGGVPLRDAGRHALKGRQGEWQLFAVKFPIVGAP